MNTKWIQSGKRLCYKLWKMRAKGKKQKILYQNRRFYIKTVPNFAVTPILMPERQMKIEGELTKSWYFWELQSGEMLTVTMIDIVGKSHNEALENRISVELKMASRRLRFQMRQRFSEQEIPLVVWIVLFIGH